MKEIRLPNIGVLIMHNHQRSVWIFTIDSISVFPVQTGFPKVSIRSTAHFRYSFAPGYLRKRKGSGKVGQQAAKIHVLQCSDKTFPNPNAVGNACP